MDGHAFSLSATAQIRSLAATYCGVDVSEKTHKEVFLECAALLRKNFGEMSILEIHEAFALAAARKIEADLSAYHGKFTVNMFGAVLAAYRPYRTLVLAALDKGQDAHLAAIQQAEDDARNEEYRQFVVQEFAALCFENRRFDAPEKIPLRWAENLSARGLLESDGEMWKQSKRDVRAEFLATAQTVGADMTIGTEKQVRNIAEKCRADPDYFPPELTDRAKNLYGRRLIFKHIAPFAP